MVGKVKPPKGKLQNKAWAQRNLEPAEEDVGGSKSILKAPPVDKLPRSIARRPLRYPISRKQKPTKGARVSTACNLSLKSWRSLRSSLTSGSGSGSRKKGPGRSDRRSISTEGNPGGLKASLRSRRGDLDLRSRR